MASRNRSTWLLASKLLSASLFAQAAAVVATGVAATRTTPEDFARFGAVAALSAVVASVNSLATQTRIPVLDAGRAAQLSRVGITGTAGASTAMLCVACLMFVNGAGWADVAALAAFGSAFLAMTGLLSAFAMREQRQAVLARSRVAQGLTNASLLIVLVLSPLPGHLALSLAWVVSLATSVLVLGAAVPRLPGGAAFARRGDWGTTLQEVRTQPLSNLLAGLSSAWPALLLPLLGANVLAGAWGLLNRVLSAVVSTIFLTVSPIYVGTAAALIRDGEVSSLARRHRGWVRRLSLLIPFMLGGTVIGVLHLLPLLGDQWTPARDVLVPACLFFTASAVWLPLSQTLIMLGRIRQELAWTVISVVGGAGALLTTPWSGAQAALTGWAVFQVMAMLLHLTLQRRALDAHARGDQGSR